MYGYETFHEKTMLDLINAVRTGQARHAYIFEGAQGLSVYSSAQLFAAALTCSAPGDAPCGACHNCHLAKSGTSPDIITVQTTKKKSIGVDEIREVASDVIIKPFNSKKKVYIIKDAALMTPQAQNAFLKTLEEPPSFAVFILIADDEENLLQTVRSRCVTVRFPRVGEEIVRKYVSEKYPDSENIDFLVRYAAGIPGSVDSVIGDESFDELRHESFDTLARLMSARKLDAYAVAEFLEKHEDTSSLILEMWIDLVRDIILLQHDCAQLVVNADFEPRLIRAANNIDEGRAVRVQQRLITAVKMRKRNVNLHAMAMWLALGD